MINYVIVIFVSVANLLLGTLVLSRNVKKASNIYFAGLAYSLSAWSVVTFFEDEVANINIVKNLVNIDFALSVVMAYFFLMFSVTFLTDRLKRKYLYYLASVFGIIFVLLSLVGKIATGVDIGEQGAVNFQISYLFYPYAIYLVVVLAAGIMSLVKKHQKKTGTERHQLTFVLYGLSLSAIITVITNLVLPRITETTPSVTRMAIYGFLIFTGLTTYAIVKHRLMDIRMVVARSVAYSLLIVLMGGLYASAILLAQTFIFPEATYSTGQVVLQIFLALVMAFSFQPLRRWITKVTDKVFFKEAYNTEELLDVVAHTVGSTIILIEMLYKTLDILMKNMKITRGVMVVFSDTGTVLESQANGYKQTPTLIAKDLVTLAHDGLLSADELPEGSKFKKILAHYDASVCVPLKTDNGTEGVLLLGEKQSGDMYSQNDLKVLEIIAPEVAVSITNAKSYEKIERFNVTLRQEVKKATHELEKKNEQLRELDKAKDEFISMASHQLRTPLTAIKGYLSMLLEGDAGEIKVSQYDFVNEAFSGANRMVGLINDLLNVSRMETGRFFLEPVEVDMERLVNEEFKQLANHAKEKGLKFNLNVKGKIPKVWVDETKIRQVVMNFTDNALYYTTAGSVTVNLKADKKDITFEVTDTGIGVPKNQQKNLFTKFYRADNARHVRPDGTGLGIYLAKRVMDDHGGTLIFHSAEGKGSTFGFKLPIKSKLKIKRVSAPQPASPTAGPGIGELAAGVGVPVETLEATQAVGIEHPLADSSDVKDVEKTAKELKR